MEFTLLEVFIIQRAMADLHEQTLKLTSAGPNNEMEREILRKLTYLNSKYSDEPYKIVLKEVNN